ncbi:hypothetical protein ABK040_004444 [Willaertia magna]
MSDNKENNTLKFSSSESSQQPQLDHPLSSTSTASNIHINHTPKLKELKEENITIDKELVEEEEILEIIDDNENNFLLKEEENNNSPQKLSSNYLEKSTFLLSYERGIWLVALLLLQSISSFILSYFEKLLQKHIIIPLFLTMLIGAGGNSGGQSTVEIVRRIATGEIKKSNIGKVLWKEFKIGICLSIIVGIVAFVRVYFYRVTNMPEVVDPTLRHLPSFLIVLLDFNLFRELIALTLSIFIIVLVSVIVCAIIPIVLHFVLKFDTVSSSSVGQVIMDCIGVLITCVICAIILP